MKFAEKMLGMLTSAYNRTDIFRLRAGELPETNIGKLFYLSGWGFDIIRDETEKVKLWDDIDHMSGTTLDRFGEDFGVVRGEASDAIMRVMVKVKIIAMLAAGNLDTIICSAASLFGIRPEDVKHEEVYPAKVFLYIDEDKLDQEHKEVADVIAGLISRIKSAGIGTRIFYRTYYEAINDIRLALMATEKVRLHVGPDVSDKYITVRIPVNGGIPTLIYMRCVFRPKKVV